MANKISENIRKLLQKKSMFQDCLSKGGELALNMIVKIETRENLNSTSGNISKNC